MNNNSGNTARIHPQRLFVASCFALVSTSVSFAVVGDIMGALKEQFVLTNQQVGYIAGAQLWGFTLSIFILGPLCDFLGMRALLRLAFLGHFAAVLVMAFANGFWMLFGGALACGMANGCVEAAGNPLVATLFPDRKTEKMNQFHVWFPGGITIGCLVAYAIGRAGFDDWRLKLIMILIPTVVYGILFLGQKFPTTERVQSGVSTGEMFKATFMRPLLLLLLVCMMMTASVELGPNRWMPAVSGILVLSWITALMGISRYFAGPVIRRLSPTGILLASAIMSGLGLWWLSDAETRITTYIAATVFALGVSYVWPTMLGVVSERVPRGGALALAVMAGTGALTAGLITTPAMGWIGDKTGHEKLEPAGTTAVLQQVVDTFPAMAREAEGNLGKDIESAAESARTILAEVENGGSLPAVETANALRKVIRVGGASPLAESAEGLLEPADNYGGRVSFRAVACLSIVLTVIFGILYFRDRATGGYRAEKIGEPH